MLGLWSLSIFHLSLSPPYKQNKQTLFHFITPRGWQVPAQWVLSSLESLNLEFEVLVDLKYTVLIKMNITKESINWLLMLKKMISC